MSDYDFALFVIGGGSGGVRAARMAAQRGQRVALAEVLGNSGLGGTCVNVGCIPKKLYSYAAHYSEAFEEGRGFGWQLGEARFDWATLKANRAQEISRLNSVYANLLSGSGVTRMDGFARLVGDHEIELATLQSGLAWVASPALLKRMGDKVGRSQSKSRIRLSKVDVVMVG